MRTNFALRYLLVIAAAVGFGGDHAGTQGGSASLPTTAGKTLTGKSVSLPDPAHSWTLIIAGFTKSSSAPVRAWWQQSEFLCKAHPQVVCYRVAVLQDVPGIIRGMVLGGMRHDMAPAEQETFITTFENESAWKQAFGYQVPDDAYLAVVEKSGKLLWRTSGNEKAASSATVARGFDSIAK